MAEVPAEILEKDVAKLRYQIWEKYNLRPIGFIDKPYRGKRQELMTPDQKERQLIPFEATGNEDWHWSKALYPMIVTNIRYRPQPKGNLQASPQVGQLVAFSSWKLPRLAIITQVNASGINVREIVVGYESPQKFDSGRPIETVYTSLPQNPTHSDTLVWSRCLWKVNPDPVFLQELANSLSQWSLNQPARRKRLEGGQDENVLPQKARRVCRRRHDNHERLRARAQPI